MVIAIEHEQMDYLTCKFTKAKASADGSKSKDTPERSGSKRQRNVPWQRGWESTGQKRRSKPGTWPLNRQRARLSRLRKSLGKHHPNSTTARMKPEILDQAFETGSQYQPQGSSKYAGRACRAKIHCPLKITGVCVGPVFLGGIPGGVDTRGFCLRCKK